MRLFKGIFKHCGTVENDKTDLDKNFRIRIVKKQNVQSKAFIEYHCPEVFHTLTFSRIFYHFFNTVLIGTQTWWAENPLPK